jgi:hypothetical protein
VLCPGWDLEKARVFLLHAIARCTLIHEQSTHTSLVSLHGQLLPEPDGRGFRPSAQPPRDRR